MNLFPSSLPENMYVLPQRQRSLTREQTRGPGWWEAPRAPGDTRSVTASWAPRQSRKGLPRAPSAVRPRLGGGVGSEAGAHPEAGCVVWALSKYRGGRWSVTRVPGDVFSFPTQGGPHPVPSRVGTHTRGSTSTGLQAEPGTLPNFASQAIRSGPSERAAPGEAHVHFLPLS